MRALASLGLVLLWTRPSDGQDSDTLRLRTKDSHQLYALQGFGASIHCSVNSCVGPGRVQWRRDGETLTSGTEVRNGSLAGLSHQRHFRTDLDCAENSRCSSTNQTCPDGTGCLDNFCCPCASEEFTLKLSNLSTTDSAVYVCQLDPDSPNPHVLEFELKVYESSLRPDFQKNLTFDHTECCEEKALSDSCKPICHPASLQRDSFNIMDCQADYNKFVSCTTKNGTLSHVHCCRLEVVPPFCMDWCTGETMDPRDSHPLCFHWLPEILTCYERAFLPLPQPPEKLTVEPLNATALKACWQPANLKGFDLTHYRVFWKQLPNLPFFGGRPPLFSTGLDSMEVDDPPGVDNRRKRSLGEEETWLHDEQGNLGQLKYRSKRQSWIFVAKNLGTNDTIRKEFVFHNATTKETCMTIGGLESETQYFVYVTATTSEGSSLPSLRDIAETKSSVFANATLPDIQGCCVKAGVSQACVPKLCDLSKRPSPFGAIDIALSCRPQLSAVAPCLADGRDHKKCCERKGVNPACLGLCTGESRRMGLSAIMCLTMDMRAIYSCLREGYVTHPSPPTSVTLSSEDGDGTVAELSWAKPKDNAHKVVSYSVFYGEDEDGEVDWTEVRNATSPYRLEALEPEALYMAYVLAHTDAGDSLPSTMVEFRPLTAGALIGPPGTELSCPQGQPLTDPSDDVVFCSPAFPCPSEWACSSSDGEGWCCPALNPVLSATADKAREAHDVRKCCEEAGISGKCLNVCRYNITAAELLTSGVECVRHMETWIACGADERDHTPCCAERGGPKFPSQCLGFCHPPLMALRNEHMACVPFAEMILQCGREGVLKLPGPPRNFRLVSLDMGDKSATFGWDAPRQTTDVASFNVSVYQKDGDRLKFFTSVSAGGGAGEVAVGGLEAGKEYTAHGEGRNSHGSSVPSNNVTFSTVLEIPDAPHSPHNLRIADATHTTATLAWDWRGSFVKSGEPVKRSKYRLTFQELRGDAQGGSTPPPAGPPRTTETDRKELLLRGLQPARVYTAFVVAVDLDSAKRSAPSESITFATDVNLQLMSLSTNPDGVLSLGDEVTAECSSNHGLDTPIRMTWGDSSFPAYANRGGTWKLRLNEDAVYYSKGRVKDLSLRCEKEGLREVVEKRLQLRYKPEARPEDQDKAETILWYLTPGLRQEVRMHCLVQGAPSPKVSWFWSAESEPSAKEQKVLRLNSSYHSISLDPAAQPDLVRSTLQLWNITASSSGFYHCQGCNAAGCGKTAFHLDVRPTPPQPRPAEKMTRCCQDNDVPEDCMSACRYDLNIARYKGKPQCLAQVSKLLHCTRDGLDHRRCCAAQGVPKHCLSVCAAGGEADAELLSSSRPAASRTRYDESCFDFTSQILGCLQQRHRVIPAQVAGVKLAQFTPSQLKVSWEPSQASEARVLNYSVAYRVKPTGDKDTKGRPVVFPYSFVNVGPERTYALLDGLSPGKEYEVQVTALSERGMSPYSQPQLRLMDARPSSASAAGPVLAVIVCLLLAVVVALGFVYMRRKRGGGPGLPSPSLSGLMSRFRRRASPPASTVGGDSVAFENPSYPDAEGAIRGLPGDAGPAEPDSPRDEASWDDQGAFTNDSHSPQKGMKYTPLN